MDYTIERVSNDNGIKKAGNGGVIIVVLLISM